MERLVVVLREQLLGLQARNIELRSQVEEEGTKSKQNLTWELYHQEGFTSTDGTHFDDYRAYRKHEYLTRCCLVEKKGETLQRNPGELDGNPFTMEKLDDCTVVLADFSEQVTGDYLTNCKVFVGASCGSVFVRDCKDCKFWLCADRLLANNCVNCDFYLQVSRPSQFQDCDSIGLAHLGLSSYKGMRDHRFRAGLSLEKTMNWQRFSEHKGEQKVPKPKSGVRMIPLEANFYCKTPQLPPWVVDVEYRSFSVGTKVEVRHNGQGHWFPAIIGKYERVQVREGVYLEDRPTTNPVEQGDKWAQRPDGTYYISYDDGDIESRVSPFRIRLAGEKQRRQLRVNDQVDAPFDAGGLLFEGRITCAHDDGTCDITFDDGDKARNVPREDIQAQCHAC
jgi:hypothetical protein